MAHVDTGITVYVVDADYGDPPVPIIMGVYTSYEGATDAVVDLAYDAGHEEVAIGPRDVDALVGNASGCWDVWYRDGGVEEVSPYMIHAYPLHAYMNRVWVTGSRDESHVSAEERLLSAIKDAHA